MPLGFNVLTRDMSIALLFTLLTVTRQRGQSAGCPKATDMASVNVTSVLRECLLPEQTETD